MVRTLSLLALLFLLSGMVAPARVAYADETEVFLPVITAGSNGQDQERVAESGNAGRSEGYPWRDHAAPYTYRFGNRMDQHQQSKKVGQDQLNGFLYIWFTDETHEDPELGRLPVAQHVDCANPPQREDGEPSSCTVGWTMHGIRVQGQLLTYGGGRPTWCIDPSSMPEQPGYTHFHWERAEEGACSGLGRDCLVYDGYLIKLTARESFRFVHAGQGNSGGGGHDGGDCGGDDHGDDGCGDEHDAGGCGDEHDAGHTPGGSGTVPGGDHDAGGGCGDDHEEGGCSGDDGHDPGSSSHEGGHGRACGANITPGIDELSHANFGLGMPGLDEAGKPICVP